MMMLAGVAAFLQITLLPGLLFTRALGLGTGAIKTITFSFAISLILNYHLVLLLTLTRSYNRSVLFSIFALEVLALFFMFKRSLFSKVGDVSSIVMSKYRYFVERVKADKKGSNLGIGVLAMSVILLYLSIFFVSIGGIFDDWDDVVSWNRWAVDWFHGDLPALTWHYPQLLPSNWSITYAFMNDGRIQFFAKSISAIFPLFSILIMLDLWLRKEFRGYLYAVPFLGLIFGLFAANYINKGYADIPVSFMALMAVYSLILVEESDTSSDKLKAVSIGALCSAGAGLTKQAGLYFALIYPILSYVTIVSKLELKGRKKQLLTVSQYVMLAVLLLPWYFYSESAIRTGVNESEISYVTGETHVSKNLLDRPEYAVNGIINTAYSTIIKISGLENSLWVKIFVVIFLLFTVYFLVCGMKVHLCRYINILLVVPYFIIWSLFFSYDVRNLTLVFPFLAICAGHGIDYNYNLLMRNRAQDMEITTEKDNGLKEKLEGKSFAAKYIFGMNTSVIVIPLSLMFAAGSFYFNDESLIRRQLRLQREIWDAETNRNLYNLAWSSGTDVVLTDYQIMRHLPGLEHRAIVVDMQDDEAFFGAISSKNVRYICFARGKGSERVLDFIISQLYSGRYGFLSDTNGWVIVKTF